jgi:anaerobic selenocysteine-containing dehydrogenase
MRRRDLITIGAGGAAGLALSPAPWKALDDVSIWSQNFPWTPIPARGEQKIEEAVCELCASRCKIGIRTIDGHPVGVSTVCTRAVGAHQLAYHKARVRQPLHHGSAVSLEQAKAILDEAVQKAGDRFAVLDMAPWRSATLTAALHGPVAPWTTIDYEKTVKVISFGAPILEHAPAMRAWSQQRLEVIQIEPGRSRTANFAQTRIAVKPGEEAAAAERVKPLVTKDTVIVSAGGFDAETETAIVVLGGTPQRDDWSRVPGHSLDLLIIRHGYLGESLPGRLIESKLSSKDAMIVSFSPFQVQSTLVIPTAAFLEKADEVTGWIPAQPELKLADATPRPRPTLEGVVLISQPAVHGVDMPLATKLNQESKLTRRDGCAYIHPETGRQNGLTNGCRVTVGQSTLNAVFSPEVLPGTVEASVDWTDDRYTAVTLRRA